MTNTQEEIPPLCCDPYSNNSKSYNLHGNQGRTLDMGRNGQCPPWANYWPLWPPDKLPRLPPPPWQVAHLPHPDYICPILTIFSPSWLYFPHPDYICPILTIFVQVFFVYSVFIINKKVAFSSRKIIEGGTPWKLY